MNGELHCHFVNSMQESYLHDTEFLFIRVVLIIDDFINVVLITDNFTVNIKTLIWEWQGQGTQHEK